MANQINVTQTPHTNAELAAALVPALIDALGGRPRRTLAELMLAQILMETADGTVLRNENVGNVVAIQDQDFYVLSAANPNHFRAFKSLDDGMAAFVHEIVRRKSMVQAGNAGDAHAYVQAISDTNYTPGIDVPATTVTLQRYVARFRTTKLFDNLPMGSIWGKAFALGLAITAGVMLKRRFFG